MREFSREDERKLCIVFDNPAVGVISEAAYERAVNLAASLAWHFSSQDAEVSFLVAGQERVVEVNEFLARLAVIEPTADAMGNRFALDVLREIKLGQQWRIQHRAHRADA